MVFILYQIVTLCSEYLLFIFSVPLLLTSKDMTRFTFPRIFYDYAP